MALTPYPNGNDNYENPSIFVSQDGIHWSIPTGLTNPIDSFPGGTYHNGDVELILGQDDDLYCYYIDTIVTGYRVLVRSSSDGITWGSETALFTGSYALSPTVVYDGSQYVMYYVKQTDNSLRSRTSSFPNNSWSNESSSLSISSEPSNTNLWHIFVRQLLDNTYLGLFHYPPTGQQLGGSIYWVTSSDGTTWTVESSEIATGDYSFNSSSVYRSCFVEDSTGDYTIWHSGRKTDGTWRVGWKQIV